MSALKFTSVEDTPEMVQAKVSNKLAVDVSSAVVCALNRLFNETTVECKSDVIVSPSNIRIFHILLKCKLVIFFDHI